MTPLNARLRGLVIVLLGLPLLCLGWWLLHVVMARPLPAWLPAALQDPPHIRLPADATPAERLTSGAGIASLLLLAFGVIALVQGMLMLILGRRSLVLLAVMALFVLILIGSGLSQLWSG